MKNITNLSITEFQELISQTVQTAVQSALKELRPAEQPKDELLKINEVAKLFNVTVVTIHAWKREGKLPFYRLGNKVFFKKQEVIDAMNKPNNKPFEFKK